MSEQAFNLTGRTALITGATGYLGESMARCLAQAGAHVYINSRSSERCETLASSLRADGLKASEAVFDVAQEQEVDAFFCEFSDPLHILVNNAYAGAAGSIAHSTPRQYQESYKITVTAAHLLLVHGKSALQKAVKQSGDASVINIASMYGLVTPDADLYASSEQMNPPFYGAAKAALLHWSRYASREFASLGIRVNCLSPGPFPSETTQATQPEFINALSKKVPLGRIGHPNDLSGPLLLLASSSSQFMTGANIVVDGGWTCNT